MMALRRIVVVVLSMSVSCLHVQTAAQNASGRPKPFAESHTTLKSADHQFLPYDLPVYNVEGSENENFRYYAPALRLVVIEGSGGDATVKRNYLSRGGDSCAIEDDCDIDRVQLFLQRVNQGQIVGAIRGQNTDIEADPLLAEYQLESGEMYDGRRFQSASLSVGTWSSDGPVPVSFTLGPDESAGLPASNGRNETRTVVLENFVGRATNFIRNLERGNDVLKLRYTFSGVSTDICLATYTSEARSEISVHEDRQSTAEYVTLKRVSDIAERASESQHVELNCGRDPARTAILQDFVKDHLATNAAEGGRWITWQDAATMLSPQDRNDFSTSVIREGGYTNQDIDGGREDRDGSWAIGGDARGCYGPVCLGAGAAFAETDTTSEQTYIERGVAYTFTGERYMPQQIAVYRSDAVQRAVETLATYNLGSKEVERGLGDVTLSFAQAWVRQGAMNPLYSSYESVHAEVGRLEESIRTGLESIHAMFDGNHELRNMNLRAGRDLDMQSGRDIELDSDRHLTLDARRELTLYGRRNVSISSGATLDLSAREGLTVGGKELPQFMWCVGELRKPERNHDYGVIFLRRPEWELGWVAGILPMECDRDDMDVEAVLFRSHDTNDWYLKIRKLRCNAEVLVVLAKGLGVRKQDWGRKNPGRGVDRIPGGFRCFN